MDDRTRKVFDSLAHLCSKQECCCADLLRKAEQKLDGDASAAAEVLEALKADKYVDDARYAAAFAREKSALTGWGPIKISHALAAKGLSRSDIASGLEEIDPARASDKLRSVLESKWKSLRDDPQGRLKLIKFALSRGYDYDSIRSIITEVVTYASDSRK